MYEGAYRNIQNALGLKSLLKPATMPPANLAVAGDDEMSNVPLTIFRYQNEPMPIPVMPSIQDLPYEKTAVKGAGDTLSMADFVTNDFQLGNPVEYV